LRFTQAISSSRRGSIVSHNPSAAGFQPPGASYDVIDMESRPRSFWRLPGVERLLGWVMSDGHERALAELKHKLEAEHGRANAG
jgi:hypothetical protein